jgi:hypothetical protein
MQWFKTINLLKYQEQLGPIKWLLLNQCRKAAQWQYHLNVNLVIDIRVNDCCYSNPEILEVGRNMWTLKSLRLFHAQMHLPSQRMN